MAACDNEQRLILASSSVTRRQILSNAGIEHIAVAANLDEVSLRHAMIAEGFSPRDIADALAENKAMKIARKHPDDYVLGCDQVAVIDHQILEKVTSPEALEEQLQFMQSQRHELLSALVLYHKAIPIWRIVDRAELKMKALSASFISSYVERNWDEVRYCVGGYAVEKEGMRLFEQIKGDHYTILGLPILPLIGILELQGVLKT